MKLLVTLFFIIPFFSFSQLVTKNEKVLFSFETSSGKKMVLVTNSKNDYLQYRFGTNKNIEMIFPEEKNSSSWKKFQYNSYSRGGGIGNAAQEIDNLAFTNNNVVYTIYRAYFSEGNSFITGILIDKNSKKNRIKGKYSSIVGGLYKVAEAGNMKNGDIGLEF